MLKCEKCGSNVPNESKFCLNCGNRIDSSAPKHFSLDEIARQQQEQESNAFSITPEVPDDDPESYLPPIGAKEHSEIPKGEIDPEYFNRKPLPSIQAADPLELLDADTPELPPIGFSDQMQIEDIKMPEGIRHYHGNFAVPRNLQMQTCIPVSENGDTYSMLMQAQMQYQMTGDNAHGDKEHFSVIPENLQIRFRNDTDSSIKKCSFNDFFIDEYSPQKDIPPAVTERKKKTVVPKKVSVKPKVSSPKNTVEEQPKVPKVTFEKSAPPPQPTVTFEKPVPPPEPKVTLEKSAPPPEPKVTLEKSAPPPEPKVTLEKSAPPPEPKVTLEKSALPPEPKVTLEKTPDIPKNDFTSESFEIPKNDFGNTQNNFNFSQNNFNNQSFSTPQNNFNNQNLSTPQNDFNNQNFGTPQNDFNNFMFSDTQSNFGSQSMGGYNDFNKPTMSYSSSGYATVMPSYTQSTFDKIMLISGLALFALRAVLIILLILMAGGIFGDVGGSAFNNFSMGGSTYNGDVTFDKESVKWSNLNGGGLAAEDDDGNVYYTNAGGCLCKISPDGMSKSIIYNGSRTNNYILYINFHNDKVYFLASVTGKNYSVCSVDKDGKNFKVYSEAKNPVCLLAHGNYLYYITEDSQKIDRINLKTEKSERFYNASGAVTNMFVHGDKMYVLSISSQYSGGNVEAVNVAAPSAIVPVSFEYMSQRIKPMGISLNGDKIIITEDGIVYSCSVDGGSAEKLGGSNIVKVAGCGSHIYYLTVGGNIESAALAVADGSTSGIFRLGMMENDGSSTYTVKDDVIYFSAAGNRIYYVGSDGYMYSMATNGTDIQTVP